LSFVEIIILLHCFYICLFLRDAAKIIQQMSDNFLFGDIEKEFGRELRTDINYPFVNNNLNPKLKLRAYQKQAFTRFYFYQNQSLFFEFC
jgi:hypothetical protein